MKQKRRTVKASEISEHQRKPMKINENWESLKRNARQRESLEINEK